MRLSKIKLAGFKSFVDPTVLHLPGNLLGVVGPNGCGKSNVIDAVRWVMGESSARSLRGESMNDVIFNGSASRKPVGQATVELVFDNSQGRLGGPWAGYGEIAVKRLVGRDGQSSYFLNGAPCRRRDIADIFLGTGLGPRSYAIVEQGMISRVIESKPDELRVFLEEAAGISKYKERRRETETRIRHTRENLDRLTDVREELGRQLQHLQRQARAAEQYRGYRAEERRLRAELLALRWRDLQTDGRDRERALRREETALEALLAEQRQLEAQLETGRARRLELNDAFNDRQGRYYQAGAEISRLEQALQHQRELSQRREEEWGQITAVLTQVDEQWRLDREQRDDLATALAAAGPELTRLLSEEASAAAALTAAETALHEGQAVWETFNQRHGEMLRQTEVERTRIEHLERQLPQSERRLERLRLEREQLAEADLHAELAALRSNEQAAAAELKHHQEQLARAEADLAANREAQQLAEPSLRELQERLLAGRGRLTSLQTLQEAALGRHEGGADAWLRAQGLADAPRLAECVDAEPGWEAAVETVLAGWLDAVCLPNLDSLAHAAAELSKGRLTLLETFPTERGDEAPPRGLAARVRAPWPLASLLHGVDIATTLTEALARREDLRDGETLVTPDGVLCGRRWLRLARGDGDGVLAREREIHRLVAALDADAAVLERQTTHLEQLRARQRELERERRDLQQAVDRDHRDHARLQGECNTTRVRWEQARVRRAALAEELAELNDQHEQNREQAQLARLRLEEAQLALESLRGEQVELSGDRERRREQLQQCRTRTDTARQKAAHQAAAIETQRVRANAAGQAMERLDAQRQQLQTRRARLAEERAGDDSATRAAIENELAGCLETRLAVEAELREARHALEAQDAALEAGEQSRAHRERQAETQRQRIEEQRLALSEARVRQQNLREQLRELAAEPEAVLPTLPEAAAENDWLGRLEQVERRIQRLGSINLAAIEEFAQLSERKQYLDAQNADLLEALTTLENAIRKIDRETRARFQETFERVNAGLSELFPRLFGGGQAHLELTGEDVLDAGVAIMAKPPGKRVGSIGLLSGGEKALAAVALVFAIFQLNPAPFCLLDEVDAPLDEANVGRFGALVRDMSMRVQFIFITHNKATMEIAEHLAGVTMQEPGVSRLVAVDVEAAARLVVAG
ncbi:MAG: chromosome segregation protein SMC [Candidatus Competibacter sp.]|nr:chromosome segregation protein SMC [Candidatus Competibacter sp.]MDG4585368.1 chromosome segregation protein SMC [Candidatus Competibacter sp.]